MSKKLKELRENKEFCNDLGKITDQEIAEKYGVTRGFVSHYRREKKIPVKRIHNYPEGIEKIAGKMTDREAAEKLNCTPSRVWNYRYENEIESFQRKDVIESKTIQVIKDYEELGTLQKVADKYGCTREWIRQMLKKSGYEKRYYNHNHPGA